MYILDNTLLLWLELIADNEEARRWTWETYNCKTQFYRVWAHLIFRNYAYNCLCYSVKDKF